MGTYHQHGTCHENREERQHRAMESKNREQSASLEDTDGAEGAAAAGGRRASRSPGRVPISERPPEAVDRSGFDRWETDSVIGVEYNLHTEMKRRTRFLMARVIPDKTADESIGGIVDGNTIQNTHSKRFIRLLRSIIVLTAALGSVTFRGFVYGTLCNRR